MIMNINKICIPVDNFKYLLWNQIKDYDDLRGNSIYDKIYFSVNISISPSGGRNSMMKSLLKEYEF